MKRNDPEKPKLRRVMLSDAAIIKLREGLRKIFKSEEDVDVDALTDGAIIVASLGFDIPQRGGYRENSGRKEIRIRVYHAQRREDLFITAASRRKQAEETDPTVLWIEDIEGLMFAVSKHLVTFPEKTENKACNQTAT